MSKAIQALVIAVAVLLLMPSQSDAKTKNPPGCKNSSPTAHNPNCSGGSGTHVPSTPDKPAVEINTITHGNIGSGAGATPNVVPSGGGVTVVAPVVTPSGAISLPTSTINSVAPSGGNSGGVTRNAPALSGPVATSSGDISRVPVATNSVQPSAGESGNASSRGVVVIPPSSAGSGSAGGGINNSAGAAATGAGSVAGLVPSGASGFSAESGNASHRHGQVIDGHDPNIVPVNPLHAPAIVPHLDALGNGQAASTFNGNLPSRIEQVAPTNIAPGQYAEPVSGFGHESGNTFGQTGELGYKFVHVQELDGYPHYDSHIPPKPGKNFVPGYRAVLVSRDGVSTCAISGMGRRTIVNQNGHTISIGHAETLHFRSSSTAHLPSNHQMASHCLVLIKK